MTAENVMKSFLLTFGNTGRNFDMFMNSTVFRGEPLSLNSTKLSLPLRLTKLAIWHLASIYALTSYFPSLYARTRFGIFQRKRIIFFIQTWTLWLQRINIQKFMITHFGVRKTKKIGSEHLNKHYLQRKVLRKRKNHPVLCVH